MGSPPSQPAPKPSNAPQLSSVWRLSMTSMPRPPLRIFSRSWMAASVPCAQQEPQYTCSSHEISRACAAPDAALKQGQHARGSVLPEQAFTLSTHRDVLVPAGCAETQSVRVAPVEVLRGTDIAHLSIPTSPSTHVGASCMVQQHNPICRPITCSLHHSKSFLRMSKHLHACFTSGSLCRASVCTGS